MTKLENNIISILFKAKEGLYAYTLFQRLNTTPKGLLESVESLTKSGIVSSDNERIQLTALGLNTAIKKPYRLKSETDSAKKIPGDFVGPRIEINKFYIPKKVIDKK